MKVWEFYVAYLKIVRFCVRWLALLKLHVCSVVFLIPDIESRLGLWWQALLPSMDGIFTCHKRSLLLLALLRENVSVKVVVVWAHYLTAPSGSLVHNFRGHWCPVASLPLFNANTVIMIMHVKDTRVPPLVAELILHTFWHGWDYPEWWLQVDTDLLSSATGRDPEV